MYYVGIWFKVSILKCVVEVVKLPSLFLKVQSSSMYRLAVAVASVPLEYARLMLFFNPTLTVPLASVEKRCYKVRKNIQTFIL